MLSPLLLKKLYTLCARPSQEGRKDKQSDNCESVETIAKKKNDVGQEEGHKEQGEAEKLRWFQAKIREEKGV